MLNSKQLLDDLNKQLTSLEKDLLERSDSAEVPQVQEALRAEYERAQAAARTAQSYEEWQSDFATQVAVAWVLGTVFVRFLEDNDLIESPKLAGTGERLQRARDEHELYFRAHPTQTDRDYLLAVFKELGQLPGMAAIFLEQNPIFELPNWLSGDAAGGLLNFFQKIDPSTGTLVHDFLDAEWDTRFLGDLYQDLSEAARKKYALLQTPIFVEEFILDRTLDPAIEEFGLEGFRMIDPACGSGHFLLGAFARILDRWQRLEPGTNVRALAQRALDAVHGVDVNPYAVAVTRFRLLLAAMKASEIEALRNAPGFKFRLACGDSLLHGEGSQLVLGDWAPMAHHFRGEDIGELNRILKVGYYHAVVANPPYITPKDRSLNELYRERYETCYRKYSLSVPFLERIFLLAVPRGFTGQITANSFMKREFGKKLIEAFFPKVDLTHVIDTSGAYIPGHGTPTVILFGQNQLPVSKRIRTVMGIRGEPSTPENASQGLVWCSILNQIDLEGSENEFVSVADSNRKLFHKHPWSIGGGGASDLKDLIEQICKQVLSNVVHEVGVIGMTNADEVMLAPIDAFRRKRIEKIAFRRMVLGDQIRDWNLCDGDASIVPYSNNNLLDIQLLERTKGWLWPCRTNLGNRATFSRLTYFLEGRPWWEWHQIALYRLHNPLLITFAFVATHNHFVLDRGGKVFNRTAPVIKLPAGATEDEHLALLGLLNSSVACFWMKQVTQIRTQVTGMDSASWRLRREFDGTKLKNTPIPDQYPLCLAKQLDSYAQKITTLSPTFCLNNNQSNLQESLAVAKQSLHHVKAKMISLQEELDWECYRHYNLLTENLNYSSEPPSIQSEQRAFAILMARQIKAGELETSWFEWHGFTPVTELPDKWSDDYKRLVEKRIELIETDKNIGLIEQPEYKRRWEQESWDSQLQYVLETWLLNRIESYFDFDGRMNDDGTPTAKIIDSTLISTAKITDIARQDPDFLQVGELYRNDPAFNVQTLIDDLINKQTVPLLPSLRYKSTGLRKRKAWEHTWNLQRQEDEIDARTQLPKNDPDYLDTAAAKYLKEQEIGTIPVPPKYENKDFAKPHYWTMRGKLDVPKERWVSFPHCEGPDGLPVIAWAGYDHLQLTQAIAIYYVRVKEEFGGSDDPRLIPLLGCLLELLPWLKQWHNALDPDYGLKMGDYYEGFIQDEARQKGKTLDDVRA